MAEGLPLPQRWLDPFAFGARVLGGGEDPWANPPQMGPFLRELDRYLSLGPAQLHLAAALAAVSGGACDTAALAAHGSALRTALDAALESALGAGPRSALILGLPGPGTLAGTGDDDAIDDAALALANLVRAVFRPGLAAIALDEGEAAALDFLGPIRNLARHYAVPFVLRGPMSLVARSEDRSADLSYPHLSEEEVLACAPGEHAYAEIPADAEPDRVMGWAAALRG
ncbi:MAG: hypothetical protein GC199_04405 [Alphaproteobacteria bacterium]|nr:hypothetical protein [Alphaproteobacteria bacterium]